MSPTETSFHPTRHHVGGPRVTRLKRTVLLGVKSIWLHGLRSMLTMLGIVFGVSSVIAMLAVGEGASHEAQEQLRQLGSNTIILKSVKPPSVDRNPMQRGPGSVVYGLTYTDVSTIRNTIPGVRIVVPARIIKEEVWNLTRKVTADIVGTVPWYPEMRKHHVARGRFLSDVEMDNRMNVCVIGEEMARKLFPVDDPIGKNVKVKSDYYKVIGVMEPRGKAASGEDKIGVASGSPNRLYIPLTAAKSRFGEMLLRRSSGSFESETVELHELTVQVKDQNDVIETGFIIGEILDSRHKNDDYEVIVPLDLLRQAERSAQIFNVVLGAIAGISLLVGGIGIMNIMLASVTERTREIGIRRALGAKKRDIVIQFLTETVILSGTGGLIGVALGITIPFFISIFAAMYGTPMPTIVTLWAPVLAFSISGLVGVVFGIYPAMRAADMDPVEALRHE